jgi:(S)-mandelate dehydrogenase
MKAINIADLQRSAHRVLPVMVRDYLEGGAQDERTLQANPEAFRAWRFLPRRLVELHKIQTQTQILGDATAFPAVVAPTGLNALFWPQGDLALARAAQRAQIPFTLSTASSVSLEDVARQAGGRRWFQLYVIERELAFDLVNRARQAGYECLVVTVDVVANGKRERDLRNGFALPVRYRLRTLWDGLSHPAWSWRYLRHGLPVLGNFNTAAARSPAARAALLGRAMDRGFNWETLEQIRQQWPGKMLVKGVLHPHDVMRCRQIGMDGVVLSNHGGRQLDDACTALEVLAQLPRFDHFDVLVDGGVRRGSDIAKAVALGASAVMVGRAALYGLASNGEDGVLQALTLLHDEYRDTLLQLGCPTTSQLGPAFLQCAAQTRFIQSTETQFCGEAV